jgi:hypothetical protein
VGEYRSIWTFGCIHMIFEPLLIVISLCCVGHPFDLTKVRLQTAAPGTYTGALDVVKKTLAKDGVRGWVHAVLRYHDQTADIHDLT